MILGLPFQYMNARKNYLAFELFLGALAGFATAASLFCAGVAAETVVNGDAKAELSPDSPSPRGVSSTTTQPSRSLVARCA